MSDHVSLRFTLLDNQLVDIDQRPVGRIDDLELDTAHGTARITAILVGAQALGERLGGMSGQAMSHTASRLRQGPAGSTPAALDVGLVSALQPLVQISVALRELPHLAALERWLADHVVGPMPGAGDARQ